MKISIGSDHGGYELKEQIKSYLEKNHDVKDHGTFSKESVDFPSFAKAVSISVSRGDCDRGVLICRNGIGMSIAANRLRGVRAVTCYNSDTAKSSRFHDETNVLCLGADFTDEEKSLEIIEAWLKQDFDDNEHRIRRLKKMDEW
ncbi:ribose 5-phosphate isomerase B [Candidatus Aenigmatarchaeota archaeon]